jgi:hypothetical protein
MTTTDEMHATAPEVGSGAVVLKDGSLRAPFTEARHEAQADVNDSAKSVDARHCEHRREDGRPCKGWKVTGSPYCAGHSGLGVAASPEVAAAAARQSAEVRQMKAQVAKRRPIDVVREGLEADAEAFYRVRREIALDSSAPTGDRLRAIEQLESRALGKPKETVEHQGDGKSEADRMLDRMSTEELEELARSGRHLRVLNEGAATADEPAGSGD